MPYQQKDCRCTNAFVVVQLFSRKNMTELWLAAASVVSKLVVRFKS
jgi:hypothetical protein